MSPKSHTQRPALRLGRDQSNPLCTAIVPPLGPVYAPTPSLHKAASSLDYLALTPRSSSSTVYCVAAATCAAGSGACCRMCSTQPSSGSRCWQADTCREAEISGHEQVLASRHLQSRGQAEAEAEGRGQRAEAEVSMSRFWPAEPYHAASRHRRK